MTQRNSFSSSPSCRSRAVAWVSAAIFSLGVGLGPAGAHQDALSTASALSALPVAVSVVAPVGMLSGAAVLTVVSVQVLAEGTVWVLQRASDGARVVVRVASASAGMASVAAGAAVTVTAVSAGHVLSAAGQVLAFVPNELGKALLFNEKIGH